MWKSIFGGQRASFSVVQRTAFPWSAARRPQLQLPLLPFKHEQEAYEVLLQAMQQE